MGDTIHKDIICSNSIIVTEKSTDPSDPISGNSVIWVGNGTDTGQDGDLIALNNNGSSVVSMLLGCRVPTIVTEITADVSYNGTTPVNIEDITIGPGTWLITYTGTINCPPTMRTFVSSVGPTDGTAIAHSRTGAGTNSASAYLFNVSNTFVYTTETSVTLYWNIQANVASSALAIDIDYTVALTGNEQTPTICAYRIG